MGIREFEDNGNKKLAYSGQRLEEMENDCIGSQGPQQSWQKVKTAEHTMVYQKVKAVCE